MAINQPGSYVDTALFAPANKKRAKLTVFRCRVINVFKAAFSP
jgi:hypothetical protein